MAKVKLDYMSLSMRAEGSDDMVRELSGRFLDMADKYAAPGFYFPALPLSVFEDGCRDPEELNTGDMKPLTTPKEVAPGADWDVVAIYDDAGIPSIMHRFRRMSNKELFGGSDKPHPAFIIGGEVYDEIYISVYPNAVQPAVSETGGKHHAGRLLQSLFQQGRGLASNDGSRVGLPCKP